jgi:nitric oxide reductase subunit C
VRIVHRKLMVGGLLAAFATQGFLVYADDIGNGSPRLPALADEGRRLWLAHNCSACHQIHGFGGFLGPDLTNAAQRVSRGRLDEILTAGSLQMPAFRMDRRQIDAVEAWLQALDRTGQGQARRSVPPPATKVLEVIAQRLPVAANEQAAGGDAVTDASLASLPIDREAVCRGHAVFASRCTGCHVPLRATSLGVALAPDPTTIAARLSREEIERTLVDGRLERGMPPAGLEPHQRRDVIAFLAWLGGEREALRAAGCECETIDLPWWEFR